MPVVVDMIEPLEPCEKKIVQVSKKRRCSLSLDKTISISRQHEERNMKMKITSGRIDMEDDPYVSKVEKRRLGPVLNAVTQLLLIDSLFRMSDVGLNARNKMIICFKVIFHCSGPYS